MAGTRRVIIGPLLIIGAAAAMSAARQPARAIDWEQVPGKDITLFYPGQASWEWVLTKKSHSGAAKFRQGKNCRGCHEDEEADIGNLIVSGQKLEPDPISSKRGTIPLIVKAAYDAERFYFRLEWTEQSLNGFPVQDEDFESKVTVIIDDGSVVEAKRAGCWGACHDDANRMASSQEGIEITKYLARSRTRITRRGGGLNFKPDADIAALAERGVFLEYWQARLNHGETPVAAAGYILKDRQEVPAGAVNATAQGQFAHGSWVVDLSRPLITTAPFSKELVPGKTYSVGFAVHDAFAAGRYHHISLEHTMVLDKGEADIVALRQ